MGRHELCPLNRSVYRGSRGVCTWNMPEGLFLGFGCCYQILAHRWWSSTANCGEWIQNSVCLWYRVCVCVCAHARTRTHISVFVRCSETVHSWTRFMRGGWCWVFRSIHFHLIPLRQASVTDPETRQVASLPQPFCFHPLPPSTEAKVVQAAMLGFFTWVLGDWTQVLMLAQKIIHCSISLAWNIIS